jgi:hypothetical protein
MLLVKVSSHVNQTKCTDTSFEYYIIKLQQSHWSSAAKAGALND